MSKICRLCLQSDSEKYYPMDTDSYRHKMQSVIPEINIQMVEEPFICVKCSELLLSAYSFKSKCLQTDKDLKTYAKQEGKQIKLKDFLKQKTEDLLSNITMETVDVSEKCQKIKNIEQEVNLNEDTQKVTETLIDKQNEKVQTNENIAENSTIRVQKQKIVVNKCPICKKVFLRKHGLDTHLRTYKHYKCNICNLIRPCKNTLEEHMRVHSGERPYQCTYCGKSFAQSSTLYTHVRSVHMMERPHVCEICGIGFPVRGAYTAHKKRRHDNVEKKFVCKFCGKAYRVKSMLEQHMKWHTGEKNYICQVCSKRFVDNASLKKHLRIHNGDKPYECPICQKTFTQNYNMKIHLKSCSRRKSQTADAT